MYFGITHRLLCHIHLMQFSILENKTMYWVLMWLTASDYCSSFFLVLFVGMMSLCYEGLKHIVCTLRRLAAVQHHSHPPSKDCSQQGCWERSHLSMPEHCTIYNAAASPIFCAFIDAITLNSIWTQRMSSSKFRAYQVRSEIEQTIHLLRTSRLADVSAKLQVLLNQMF